MKPNSSLKTLLMGTGVGALLIALMLGLNQIQSMSVVALVMALWLYRWNRRAPAAWEQARGHLWIVRGTAVLSLGLWVGVLLAGRWIAYADYLFDLE